VARNADKKSKTALVRRRRLEIIQAARKVFARYGYRRARVEQVCEALGVGKGTVYRYFGTKKALFMAVANWGMEKLVEDILRHTTKAKHPLEKIECAVRAYLEFFDTHWDIIEIFQQERGEFRDEFKPTYLVYRDANIGRMEVVLRDAISRGIVRPMDAAGASRLLSELLYGIIQTHYMSKSRCLADRADEVLDLYFNGILTARGRRAMEHKQRGQE